MNIIDRLNSVETQKTVLKERYGLEYNPFPRSGIAIISESDKIVEKLMPVDEDALNTTLNQPCFRDINKRKRHNGRYEWEHDDAA